MGRRSLIKYPSTKKQALIKESSRENVFIIMIIGIPNTLRFLACTLLLMSTIGCAGMLMAKNAEPPVILARNASDVDMERVTLSSPPDVPGKPTRFGTISPVPKGASQIFVRPADPPRKCSNKLKHVSAE